MPIENGSYRRRGGREIYGQFVSAFEAVEDDPPTNEGDLANAMLSALAATLHRNQEQSLSDLYDSAYIETATGQELTWKCAEVGVYRQDASQATGTVLFERDSAATADYVIQQGTIVQTMGSNPVEFETTETVTLAEGDTSIEVNVQAVEGGTRGNVTSNAIKAMPSPPTGVSTVTNPNPTGDPSYTDTNGERLVMGLPRESDEELRERALQASNIGGAATQSAITTEIGNVEGVRSVTIAVDKSAPSIEPIVHGGEVEDVARAMMDSVAIDSQTVGGVNGTAVSHTVPSEELASGERTLNFSRPNEVTVNVDLSLVVDETYVGDEDVKDAVSSFIGGTDTAGAPVDGLDADDEFLVTDFEGMLENDDYGIVAVTDIVLDTGTDGTDDTTTDSDGLRVLPSSVSEVFVTDATDGSITINTTTRS